MADTSCNGSLVAVPGWPGMIVLHGEEHRSRAEAAGPPSKFALEVLNAARTVQQAKQALRRAESAEEANRSREAIRCAEDALKNQIKRLSEARSG